MRTRDDSAKVLLNVSFSFSTCYLAQCTHSACFLSCNSSPPPFFKLQNQNNLKNQPTLAGYIPSTMAPENSPFQNGVPTTASAPLTESALRQLQQAQAEEAQKQSLQQLQHFRGGAPPEHSPPVQSPIPPGSPDALVSNAGGAGNAVHVGGLHNSNSLSQASPFAFAAQQQQYQNQYPSRDVSGGSHVSHAGEDYWGSVSPRSGHSGTSSAAAAVGAAGVASGVVSGGAGRGAGSPTPPASLQFQFAPAPAAAMLQQWQHVQQQTQQQAPQHVFNLPVVPEYHHVASSMWPGLLYRKKPGGKFLLLTKRRFC